MYCSLMVIYGTYMEFDTTIVQGNVLYICCSKNIFCKKLTINLWENLALKVVVL